MKANFKHYAIKRFKGDQESTYVFDTMSDAKDRFNELKTKQNSNLYLLSSDPEQGYMVVDSFFLDNLN